MYNRTNNTPSSPPRPTPRSPPRLSSSTTPRSPPSSPQRRGLRSPPRQSHQSSQHTSSSSAPSLWCNKYFRYLVPGTQWRIILFFCVLGWLVSSLRLSRKVVAVSTQQEELEKTMRRGLPSSTTLAMQKAAIISATTSKLYLKSSNSKYSNNNIISGGSSNNGNNNNTASSVFSAATTTAAAAAAAAAPSASAAAAASATTTTTPKPIHATSHILRNSDGETTYAGFDRQAQDTQFAVFYNAFVPDAVGMNKNNQTFYDNAIRIVKEQVDLVAHSKAGKDKVPFVLYYNTIGKRNGLNASYMNYLCRERNQLTCQHMDHYTQGFEEVTLQKLYEYCMVHPTHRVAYMHSKGSFHSNWMNEAWRNQMTEAVMHENCLNPPDDTCNACGLLFQPIWMPLFPGNFFTAHCSYVQKLVPPVIFNDASYDAVEGAFPVNSYNFTSYMYAKIEGWDIGLDRFAQEAWVGSHPDLIPCDLTTAETIRYWVFERNTSEEFNWGMAPRHLLSNGTFFMMRMRKLREQVLVDPALRFREYYLLAGKIHKWMRLYNGTIPPPHSWFWKWFPDGEAWRAAVTKYKSDPRGPVRIVMEAAQSNTLRRVLSPEALAAS